jgi:hypothetical protein
VNSDDESLVATVHCSRTTADREDWLARRDRAPSRRAVVRPDELRHAVGVFLDLCREHVQLEESIVYPEAKAMAAKLTRRRAMLQPLRLTVAGPSSS